MTRQDEESITPEQARDLAKRSRVEWHPTATHSCTFYSPEPVGSWVNVDDGCTEIVDAGTYSVALCDACVAEAAVIRTALAALPREEWEWQDDGHDDGWGAFVSAYAEIAIGPLGKPLECDNHGGTPRDLDHAAVLYRHGLHELYVRAATA